MKETVFLDAQQHLPSEEKLPQMLMYTPLQKRKRGSAANCLNTSWRVRLRPKLHEEKRKDDGNGPASDMPCSGHTRPFTILKRDIG